MVPPDTPPLPSATTVVMLASFLPSFSWACFATSRAPRSLGTESYLMEADGVREGEEAVHYCS